MTIAEVDFEQKPEDAKPEPLRMEHFYLPLGMWFVGTMISLLFFLAEIVIRCVTKSKTDVPMTMQEEQGVARSTPEVELEPKDDIEDNKV